MIGVFDSGIGGLSALRHLQNWAPGASYVYFGDVGRAPYGTRSQTTILQYALQDLRFLSTFHPHAVLAACGTVSANALRVLQEVADFPVLGVIEFAAEKAYRITKNGKIAVLGTEATVRTHAFRRALQRLDTSLEVVEYACPLFVPMVEFGLTDATDSVVEELCRRVLAGLDGFCADTVILGCTHYPFLAETISLVLPQMQQVDAAKEAALAMLPFVTEGEKAETVYYTSDNALRFAKSVEKICALHAHGPVQHVAITRY